MSRTRSVRVAFKAAARIAIAVEVAAAAVGALLSSVAPAAAQELGVVRRSFTFVNRRLLVEVEVDVPGELQVVRGSFGRVEVAARAEHGIAGMALSRDHELVLTSLGGERVMYLVMVPENARVRIRLPGQRMSRTFWPPAERLHLEWGDERAPSDGSSTKGGQPVGVPLPRVGPLESGR